VHVGAGPTLAAFTVPDVESVQRLLEVFVKADLQRMEHPEIRSYQGR
jgi:hypothetical protein